MAEKVLKMESSNNSQESLLTTLDKGFATIEFSSDGQIQTANANFCAALGYNLEEIRGKHHRMFCEPSYTNSQEYKNFWEDLASGRSFSGEYKRIRKDGSEIWINAIYNPILDGDKNVVGVVKIASDITEQKMYADMKQMVDLSPINTMFAKPDGTLMYLNDEAKKTLKTLEQYLPERVDNIVGKSIDIFHKNPAHQRKIITDPSNLPLEAKIELGPEKLKLLISPVYNMNGEYIGPMVTWDVITLQVSLVESLTETATQLASAAEELSATATQLNQNANNTTDQSTQAAANTEEVSKGVQIVATNTEEMVASIKEISRNTSEAADISKSTQKMAKETNETIQKLGASSNEIGNVIKVISSIAQQTNLLALNATIEAARAGEAGKGFAVVANEVKELAKQTATATEDITQRIQAIQNDSTDAVGSINGISEIIEKLNSISVAIAAAVEEQTATANEVARVVKESNKGVEGIADVVSKVSGAAKESSQGASQTLDAAKSLSVLAENLRELIKKVQV